MGLALIVSPLTRLVTDRENDMKTTVSSMCKAVVLALALSAGGASAAPTIFWTDWTGSDLDSGTGFQAQGTITTGSSTVTVTYTNPQGISFYQPTGGAYYYSGGTDGAGGTSPFTSAAVDNRPPTTDIIAQPTSSP